MDRLDAWLRGPFVAHNTALEDAYFAAGREIVHDQAAVAARGARLLADGAAAVAPVLEASAWMPDAPETRYELLGLIGSVLAALRRHELDTTPEAHALLAPAWRACIALGTSLDVAPRYVFAHQSLGNPARDGAIRTFTAVPDERAFVELNGLAVLAYRRAAEALERVYAVGVVGERAAYLLGVAREALVEVLAFHRALTTRVGVDRFFLTIRPYFKPHRVGDGVWRGVNAGDFADVNVIDLALGLCSPEDPFYREVMEEKRPYLPPGDAARLDRACARPSLLCVLLAEDAAHPPVATSAALLLEACRAHGAASAFHHHRLVGPYVERPAAAAPPETAAATSSGPPLETVISTLERLRFLRTAVDRPGLTTARGALEELRARTADGAQPDVAPASSAG